MIVTSPATPKPDPRTSLSQPANLGVDVGGTSIKAAVVGGDGVFLSKRLEIATPQPATPEAIGRVLRTVVADVEDDCRVGIAFPAPIVNSTILDSANIADEWIGMDGETFFEGVLRRPVTLINDADAAGLAEEKWGAARGSDGLVLLLTLGTGIGSAILNCGRLIPNTELGMTPFRGSDIEQYAAPSVMTRDRIDEREWSERLNEVMALVDRLLHPDLIIVSGGITARWSDLADLVECGVPLVPAHFRGDAGIIGASIAARSRGLAISPITTSVANE